MIISNKRIQRGAVQTRSAHISHKKGARLGLNPCMLGICAGLNKLINPFWPDGFFVVV